MRLGWKCFMKCRNCICRVGKIFCELPSALRLVVANPIHQVIEFAAPKSGIEDRINLKLKKAIHLDRQGDLHDGAREWAGHMRLEEADMEDRMDVHG